MIGKYQIVRPAIKVDRRKTGLGGICVLIESE